MCDTSKYNTDHDVDPCRQFFRPKIPQQGSAQWPVQVEVNLRLEPSDKIRWEMDKKFTNEDIDFHPEEFNKYGILHFDAYGYVTETR